MKTKIHQQAGRFGWGKSVKEEKTQTKKNKEQKSPVS